MNPISGRQLSCLGIFVVLLTALTLGVTAFVMFTHHENPFLAALGIIAGGGLCGFVLFMVFWCYGLQDDLDRAEMERSYQRRLVKDYQEDLTRYVLARGEADRALLDGREAYTVMAHFLAERFGPLSEESLTHEALFMDFLSCPLMENPNSTGVMQDGAASALWAYRAWEGRK